MNENKIIYVDEETYKKLIEKLGYKPENLMVNRYITNEQAIVVNESEIMKKWNYWSL